MINYKIMMNKIHNYAATADFLGSTGPAAKWAWRKAFGRVTAPVIHLPWITHQNDETRARRVPGVVDHVLPLGGMGFSIGQTHAGEYRVTPSPSMG